MGIEKEKGHGKNQSHDIKHRNKMLSDTKYFSIKVVQNCCWLSLVSKNNMNYFLKQFYMEPSQSTIYRCAFFFFLSHFCNIISDQKVVLVTKTIIGVKSPIGYCLLALLGLANFYY